MKVIAITGNDAPKVGNEISAAGADAYLVKPFNIKYLVSLITDFTEQWGQERDN